MRRSYWLLGLGIVASSLFMYRAAGGKGGVVMPLAEAGQGVPFRIHPDPVAVIGATEGEELALVLDAARAPTGDVFILERFPQSVRRYSATGALISVFGQPGEGPGDLLRPISLTLVGDSLFVMDSGSRRISVFSLDGDLIRDVPARTPFAVREAERFADGRWIFRRQGRVGSRGEYMRRDTIEYFVSDERFDEPVGAGRVPGPWGTNFTFGGEPRSSLVSLTPRPVVTTRGSCAYVLTGDTPNVRVVTTSGADVGTYAFETSPARPVDAAVRQSHIEGMLSRFPDPAERERRRPIYLRDQPYLDFLPITSGLVVDAHGYVWVQEYSSDHPRSRVVRLMDPSLRYAAKVTLPIPLELVEIGNDYVLGVGADSLGEQSLYVFRLERDGGQRPLVPAACRL